jgi:hypothetical protein
MGRMRFSSKIGNFIKDPNNLTGLVPYGSVFPALLLAGISNPASRVGESDGSKAKAE